MTRIKAVLWGSRRRKVVAAILSTALVASGTAVAAFIIYSGVGGSAGGSFTSTTSTVPAFTIASTSPSPVLVPGGPSAPFALSVKNDDTGASHSLTSLDATVSSSVAGCGAYITLNGTFASIVGNLSTTPLVVAAGVTNTTWGSGVTIAASNAAPLACAGATFSVNFTGTST